MAEPDTAASGLRDPRRAARSLAAIALGFEALALLMAIAPMRMLLDEPTAATWAIVALVVVFVVLAGLSGRKWIWPVGAVAQAALIAFWFFHWALGAAGLVFAAVWAYCWYVKNQLGKPPKR